MTEVPKPDRKVLLNVQKLGGFLREFAGYDLQQKSLCVRQLEDRYDEEFEAFMSFYIRCIGGRL